MDKFSYALGLGIGQQLKQMGLKGTLVINDFAASITDVLEGNDLKVSHQEGQKIVNAFFQELEQKQNAAKAAAGKVAKEEGSKFLAENAKKDGIIVTKSGLQYEVLTEGTGKKPKATDTVRCHYEGRLLDGTVFDSSYKRNAPADFGLQQVIAGWTEGVQLMAEGAKYRFYIPYMLAYGEGGAGASIPPFATLIFDVELIKVL
ncbi:MAG: FKBP-type peptidyl-prolyl cis-trans isomerase [Bacteroidaceae bacterium]|jgi:FKBP-type peptidyl-prolyl cis-trans isomerase FklB|nr:FKBP-type peptidyl-prolyl cis-trans isomerase [Bacteroidaceae bacterium]MBQ8709245.1 FKBP-type peptidyl-prolyl cis-trans isomerase [Bacteroidaceae bacterium]MBR1493334.1 FKBP-type peptidyl-prolyl cis-trans isomerase [Bacteroidaceae bacterium]MBS7322561.1 FKBP-type peptidyl-prolyl cis-trans isomerase [Bacteroidaceae bacterium]MCI6802207.1 FKBP-type peptidyl-prolyl cis-trans isomerase [Prevotellaceae bacterium]